MTHEVKFSLPDGELGKSDIELRIKRGGTAFGTLRISKGALVWVPANKQLGHRITWPRLDQIAADEGARRHR